ncbi:MAG: hypothetical protein IJE97_10785 [Thermoguttaceae bacterium]|nr:hypothetical protein [Thermoguttaceae bacterium]
MSFSSTPLKSTVYVVGTDEAGYGPNLGPLLVAASCWTLQTERLGSVEALRRAFSPSPESSPEPIAPSNVKKPSKPRRSKKSADVDAASLFDFLPPDDETLNAPSFANAAPNVDSEIDVVSRRIDAVVPDLNDSLAELCARRGVFPLADSKKLYGPSKSLATLERSFWLAVGSTRRVSQTVDRAQLANVATWRSALALLSGEPVSADAAPPWERDVDFPLPSDAKTGSLNNLNNAFTQIDATFERSGVSLVDVAARRVQPLEFNNLITRLGLKSDLIADVTTSLVVETILRALQTQAPILQDFDGDGALPVFIVLCDKLGGRDRYAPLLAARFPDADVKTLVESRAASVYRLCTRRGVVRDGSTVEFPTEIAVEIRFTAKGEANVPTALASICAKYFRELSMIPFNDFWRRAVDDANLRPTAGYPLVAKRFRAEVDEARRRLNIADTVFWRER